MISRVIACLAVVVSLCATAAHAGEKLLWKTETTFAKVMGPLGDCKADDEECMQADHVSYMSISHYGRTMYTTSEEASRIYISFDASLDDDRDAQSLFALLQVGGGAVDWGGVMEGEKFKPLYAIKRIYDPGFDWSGDQVDQNKSGLYVWRLSEAPGKGRSTIIGDAGPENAEAREMAEKDFATQQKSKE